jgi:hypothetical protein
MHTRRIIDIADIAILGTTAIAGVTIGVFDYLDALDTTESKIPGAILVLLGLVALHMSLDGLLKRIDAESAARVDRKIEDLPVEQRQAVNAAVLDYVRVQQLKRDAQEHNPQFPELADALLSEHAQLLNDLASGCLVVPKPQIGAVQEKLSRFYKRSFEAVSERDLDFWLGPESDDYYEAGLRAIVNSETSICRIFICNLHELEMRTDDLVKVLTQQLRGGIGWGIAVEEEFDPELSTGSIDLDFALFNHDKALSFFRKTDGRRFEAIMNTPENWDRIARQRAVYDGLVAECWLVNNRFREVYPSTLPPAAKAAFEEKVNRSNAELNRLIGWQPTPDAHPFVMLVNDGELIKQAITELASQVRKLQKRRGFE